MFSRTGPTLPRRIVSWALEHFSFHKMQHAFPLAKMAVACPPQWLPVLLAVSNLPSDSPDPSGPPPPVDAITLALAAGWSLRTQQSSPPPASSCQPGVYFGVYLPRKFLERIGMCCDRQINYLRQVFPELIICPLCAEYPGRKTPQTTTFRTVFPLACRPTTGTQISTLECIGAWRTSLLGEPKACFECQALKT